MEKIYENFSKDRKKLELLINSSKKHEGCFNAVCLNTEYGYPSLEVHRKAAKQYAASAQMLREAGISVSLQLSNTIGHGEYMSVRDCSALVFDGSPVRKMVGHDGTVADYSFCWNDRYFRDYITEQVRIYVSEIQPDELWIDDDLRANNHAPVSFGCFCEHCISKFNKKHGTNFDRESLVLEFLHGDIETRKNYISQIREDLASFVKEICCAVTECSQGTAVCFQNGTNGPYTGYGYGHIFDAMMDTTGYAPSYRPGGGAYRDHDPNDIVAKAYDLAWQCSMLPEYVRRICPEIENLPDTAMGKTMHGTAFESTLYLANGSTDLSYAMFGHMPEPFEFYESGLELFSKHRKYWDSLSSLSSESQSGGICYASSKNSHLRKLAQNDDMYTFNREYYTGANSLLRCGIPMTYKDSDVYLLHPDTARQMDRDELTELTSKNVLTDAETVEYMQSLGIDLGFEMIAATTSQALVANEIYTEHPVNRGYLDHFSPSFFTPGRNNKYFMTKIPRGCEVLGVYDKNMRTSPITDDPELPFGYTSVITQTDKGGRWAVMACDLWKGIVPSTQRDRILNIIDYIGQGMPAKLLSSHQAIIMPRVDADGKTVGVSVTNCTIGEENNVTILIRRPSGTRFYFMSQYNDECELTAEQAENGYKITIPSLHPWSVGTVFCLL